MRLWLSLMHALQPFVVDLRRLQGQQPGNDLQVVLHPVVDLLEQHLLFLQRGADLFLGPLALGDVLGNSGQSIWPTLIVFQ